MRVGGIDPSSDICGTAMVVDGSLAVTSYWKREKVGSDPERLYDYFLWLMRWLLIEQPDIVVVEALSVSRGAETTRKISHYQAASVLACKMRDLTVIEARTTTARKHALGNGGLSKENAWAEMKKRYSHHPFARADQGGYDEMDAAVLALAGPSIAES